MSSSLGNGSAAFSRRNFLVRSLGTLALGAAGTSLLTSCAPTEAAPKASPGATEKAPVTPVPFTFLSFLPLTSLTITPEFMGVAGGYFQKNGLDTTLQVVQGSAQALQTLLGDKGQVARNGTIDVMTAALDQGQPFKVIGVNTFKSGIRFITTKDNPDPSDWVGKTFGVPSVNGTSDKTLTLALKGAGIDPGTVKRQLVGLSPGTFELVKNGTIAGYIVSLDTSIIVAAQNPDANIFDPSGLTKAVDNIYMSTEKQIDEHGDEIKKYLLSIKQATEDIRADTGLDDTLKTLRSKYSFDTLNDDKTAKAALKLYRDMWADKGKVLAPDMDRLESAYRELVDSKMIASGKKVESMMDTSLLPK